MELIRAWRLPNLCGENRGGLPWRGQRRHCRLRERITQNRPVGGPRRAGLSGHARLLAGPAYRKLLAAEPFLRRLIPILIAIFLLIVGLARFVELYDLRIDRETDARKSIGMIVRILSDAFADAERSRPRAPTRSTRWPMRCPPAPPGTAG